MNIQTLAEIMQHCCETDFKTIKSNVKLHESCLRTEHSMKEWNDLNHTLSEGGMSEIIYLGMCKHTFPGEPVKKAHTYLLNITVGSSNGDKNICLLQVKDRTGDYFSWKVIVKKPTEKRLAWVVRKVKQYGDTNGWIYCKTFNMIVGNISVQ